MTAPHDYRETFAALAHFAREHRPDQIPADLVEVIADLLPVPEPDRHDPAPESLADSPLARQAIAAAWASPYTLVLAAATAKTAGPDTDHDFAVWADGFRAGFALARIATLIAGLATTETNEALARIVEGIDDLRTKILDAVEEGGRP